MSQIGYIKMNIEKLRRDVSRGREEVFLVVHVNTTILCDLSLGVFYERVQAHY